VLTDHDHDREDPAAPPIGAEMPEGARFTGALPGAITG
jgi:hypothetical protein